MLSTFTTLAVLAMLMAAGQASAAEYELANQPGVVYAKHDGVELVGDFYLPKGRDKAPVLVAVHGGGWQVGSRQSYRYWGLFLARAGYAVFAIDYRLGKPGMYPAAVYDTKAVSYTHLLRLAAPRVATRNTHGTGCTFASAIAAGLAKGLSLEDAAKEAKSYVSAAIAAADRLGIGTGRGPVHHFHRWW